MSPHVSIIDPSDSLVIQQLTYVCIYIYIHMLNDAKLTSKTAQIHVTMCVSSSHRKKWSSLPGELVFSSCNPARKIPPLVADDVFGATASVWICSNGVHITSQTFSTATVFENNMSWFQSHRVAGSIKPR